MARYLSQTRHQLRSAAGDSQRMPSVSLLNDQFSHDFQYVLALTRYEFYRKSKRPFPPCLDAGQGERKLEPARLLFGPAACSCVLLRSSCAAAPALAKGVTALRSICE